MGTSACNGAAIVNDRIYLRAVDAASANGIDVQLRQIMHSIEQSLQAQESTLADVCKIVIAITDSANKAYVLNGLRQFYPAGLPCYALFVANGLADPRALVQIDVDAVRGSKGGQKFSLPWSGGDTSVARVGDEIFLAAIDGLVNYSIGRSLAEASEQARLAMQRLSEALAMVNAELNDVCKITVHVPDRYYREAVYPEIGRLLADVFPVSTGLILQGLSDSRALFSIDVMAVAGNGQQHHRKRKYHTSTTLYGGGKQSLDCGFCMAVLAGDKVFLRGQTAMGLDGSMHAVGDVVGQTKKAMENVAVLLADVGANEQDAVRAILYVTDAAYIQPSAAIIADSLGKNNKAAVTACVVKGLAAPNLLMEVDIIAVKGD